MEAHLKSTYGFNEFREYQKDIINDLLNGENTFAILPTGGGKSLLYQFPATYTGKLTIVVSPLISLMNDQCNYLNSKNINSACLNSETCIDISEYKNYKIIYTTPEFIERRIAVFEKIKDIIGLFAIDEAHCVSQWSHDFRESYLKLGIIKTTFPEIPMLAVTATATPRVVSDIYEMLNIYEANEYALGTRRTNLEINIYRKRNFDLCEFTEPTIVYVQTRKACESVCEKLSVRGCGAPTITEAWRRKRRSAATSGSPRATSWSSSPRFRSGWASTSRIFATSSITECRATLRPTIRKLVARDGTGFRARRRSTTNRKTSLPQSSSLTSRKTQRKSPSRQPR